ncbi:MAG TPA: FHA domain-containing protein [Steroidobacter sp.]|nr:FHA domain-containing protein [Steroidobacter sp.]
MLALSLVDSGLVLARRCGDARAIAAEAPGIALLEEDATLTGEQAARRMRLKPLLAHSNYWRTLGVEPLARPSRLVRTTADIAYAQAQALLRPFKSEGEEGEQVLLAVPAGYTREQLSLLLGIINETGVPAAGLVDAGLAACSLEPAPARVLHLELELQHATLTVLEHSGAAQGGGLKRNRYEIALRHGVLALQQTWMQFIAEQFVRKTRFDPLHEAAAEQRMFDQLPQWLRELQDADRITPSMQFGERALEIEIERAQFVAAVDKHYGELVRLVQAARIAGMPIELRLSDRAAVLPGLLERLRALRDCTIQVLQPGAAALGALQYEAAIRRPSDALALVHQLPTPRAAATRDSMQVASTPAPLRPTHVLFQGRAWRLSEQPLVVGWAVEPGRRSLPLPNAAPGVSRSHCTLVRRDGAVILEDHSTYGSYINDERVFGRTVLTVGDRLRLGAPGVTLEMIQLVNDDGAPQD